jgi:predicted oxidoreductase (fatty acid repression mutant protein)
MLHVKFMYAASQLYEASDAIYSSVWHLMYFEGRKVVTIYRRPFAVIAHNLPVVSRHARKQR